MFTTALLAIVLLAFALALGCAWFGVSRTLLGFELVRTARRGLVRHRLIFLSFLLLVLLLNYLSWFGHGRLRLADLFTGTSIPGADMSRFAGSIFSAFFWTQMAAVFLLTPIQVAGAIIEEKQRRTLEMLLATDLTSREIVLTKLIARLAGMVLLVLAGLPVLAGLQFLGGVDPNLVLAGFAITLLTMLALGAISILSATFAARMADAVFRAYFWGFAMALVLSYCWGIIESTQLESLVVALVAATLGSLGVTVVCVRIAERQLRDAAFAPPPKETPVEGELFYSSVRPPVGDRPLLWKETYVEHHRGIRWVGAFVHAFGVVMLLGVLGFSLSTTSLAEHPKPDSEVITNYSGLSAALSTALAIGAALAAAGSLSRERERHTLDSLLSTPIEADEILSAKYAGALTCIRPASWLLGAIWLLAALVLPIRHIDLGAVAALALAALLVLSASLVYVLFFTSLGLWVSMHSTSTLRATVLTVLTCFLVIVGPIMLGRGFYFFLGFPDDWSEKLANMQVYALSPPYTLTVLGVAPARILGPEPVRTSGPYAPATTDEMVEYVPASLLGVAVYAGATWLLWKSLLKRLRGMTG